MVSGGDSAGGGSIDLHLSAYGGRDDHLFNAAAGESPSYAMQLTVDQAQYQYDALVERVGCNSTKDSLACLRALPIAKLQSANINIPTPGGGPGAPLYMYSTVIDGNFSRNFTYAEFESGNFVKVPVIFGYALFPLHSLAQVNSSLEQQLIANLAIQRTMVLNSYTGTHLPMMT